MRSVKTAWAIEYTNGRLMQGVTGVELWPTKTEAQWTINRAQIKGKPVKVRITVEKVI